MERLYFLHRTHIEVLEMSQIAEYLTQGRKVLQNVITIVYPSSLYHIVFSANAPLFKEEQACLFRVF